MVIKWKDEIKGPKQEEVVVIESTENIVSRRTALVLSIVSLGISLTFLSQNITGNVIANFSTNGANWIGGIFFILAIIGGLAYVQKRKK